MHIHEIKLVLAVIVIVGAYLLGFAQGQREQRKKKLEPPTVPQSLSNREARADRRNYL